MTVRRDLPIWLGAIGGFFVVLMTFFDNAGIRNTANSFLQWRVIMAYFALLLGGGNVLRIHWKTATLRRRNWIHSWTLIITLFVTLIAGIGFGLRSPSYLFLFNSLYSPLGATVFSMNAFYIASACYRAFRIRNALAAVLLVSGTLVMLGKVGIGAMLWSQFPVMSDWILNVPNSAAMRAMSMGSALGMVGVSLRIVLGLERGHLGTQ
jgi:hypothetical protein